jgi:signal peptidase I
MVVGPKKRLHRLGSSILTILIVLLSAALLAVFLRLFVVASYHVSTSSMEPTIMPGDYILVNQLVLGARYFKDETGQDGKKEVVAKRVPGLRKVKRNDVLVFNLPLLESMDMDVSVHYVKRCVAIPGDTFYIRNGFYRVKGVPGVLGYVDYQLRFSVVDRSFVPWGSWRAAPKDSLHDWTIKNMGPFYIPKKGDKVFLSVKNIGLYKDAIAYETKQLVRVLSDTILLGDKLIHSHVFKNDYYFMAGDNVFDSADSRYWGLLPEDHIIGKASMIWKSKDLKTGKYNFKRFFRGL